MFGQNKQQKQPGIQPNEANDAEDVVDVRENDVLQEEEDAGFVIREAPPVILDVFERQIENLFQQHKWPIDEEEPGFVQPPDDLFQDEAEAPEQINAVPGQRLFALRRHIPDEPKADPVFINRVFNKWSKRQQKEYVEEIRDLFPEMAKLDELVNKIPPDEEELQQKRRRGRNPFIERRRQENEERERLIAEERREYAEKIQMQQKLDKYSANYDNNVLRDLLRRGMQNNTEVEELKHLKYLMGDKVNGKPLPTKKREPKDQVLPSRGTAHLEDLHPIPLGMLFSRFTFQGQFVLSKLTPKWNQSFKKVFDLQTILWFCNEDQDSRRFLPIEDCCEECHHDIDYEPVIRIFPIKLIPVIDKVMCLTKNLKCLRLYRFQMDRLLVVKKFYDNCPQLQHFDLTECYDITLVFIKELCSCFPNIKHLILTATNLNEEMLSHIIKCLKTLVTLVVSSTLITGQSLPSLPNSLKRLDIRCCPLLKTSEFIKFLKFSGLIQLQHLKIDGYKNKDIYRLIWTFYKTSLILLEVTDTQSEPLSGQSYIADVPVMQCVQSLKLGKNVVFEARVFDNLINSCPNMRSFSMHFEAHDVYRLSEVNLIQMSYKWPLIERLELFSCRFLGEDFIRSLLGLNHLQHLNLTESPELRDTFMSQLLPKFLSLNYVVLDKCLNLGKRTVESAVLMAYRMTPKILRISMIRCNFQSLPTIKTNYLPENLRITYSSQVSRRYVTFDGQRTKLGNISDIWELFNGK